MLFAATFDSYFKLIALFVELSSHTVRSSFPDTLQNTTIRLKNIPFLPCRSGYKTLLPFFRLWKKKNKQGLGWAGLGWPPLAHRLLAGPHDGVIFIFAEVDFAGAAELNRTEPQNEVVQRYFKFVRNGKWFSAQTWRSAIIPCQFREQYFPIKSHRRSHRGSSLQSTRLEVEFNGICVNHWSNF